MKCMDEIVCLCTSIDGMGCYYSGGSRHKYCVAVEVVVVTTSIIGCYFYLILCVFCVRANINEMAKRVTQNLRDIHLGAHKKAEILNLLDRNLYCCADATMRYEGCFRQYSPYPMK